MVHSANHYVYNQCEYNISEDRSNPKTKVTDIVIVISIIVAVKCHSHPEPSAAGSPPFQVLPQKSYRASSCKHPRCKLPSGKLPRRRNLTNSSLHRKTVKQYQQQMMSKIIYNCCTRGFHIQLLHNHNHFSGYSSAVTCNVCHFVITTAIATRGKPYTNNKNQIKHIINSSSPPDIRAHTH